MELGELLESYGYNDTPILQGSALAALNGEQSGVDSVMELMKLLILGLILQKEILISHF